MAATSGCSRDASRATAVSLLMAMPSSSRPPRPRSPPSLDAHDLLDDVTEVLETRFWRDADRLYVDEISEDWSVVDPYRGQNANMHLV